MNQEVEIDAFTSTYKAKVIDISPHGALVVETEDGRIRELLSGEVSLSRLYRD